MAGRNSKLTPQLQKRLCTLIAKGATDKDACDLTGIAQSTFYNWLSLANAEQPTEDNAVYVEFSEAITRARARANERAIAAFRTGLLASTTKETITEEVTETRLKRNGEEYEYTGKTTRTVERNAPPDWRAGEAWLKRRDKENWSERQELTGADGGALRWEQVMNANDDSPDESDTFS